MNEEKDNERTNIKTEKQEHSDDGSIVDLTFTPDQAQEEKQDLNT
jgi:hypothetical protein